MMIKKLQKIANKSIKNAGPRYTPGIDPSAPNLSIKPLLCAMEFLTRAKSLSDKFKSILNKINDNQQSYDRVLKKYFKEKKYNVATIQACIQEYNLLTNNIDFAHLELLRKSVAHVYKKLGKLIFATTLEKDKNKDQNRTNEIMSKLNSLNKWVSIIRDLNDITGSIFYDLINKPRLLLGGEAGSGKTHFLCDITNEKLKDKSPVLLILAQDIPEITDPLYHISKIVSYAQNKKSLLQNLIKLSNNNERPLIIIDGINEGDYEGWQNHYLKLSRELAQYPQIALLISARSPHDKYFIEALPKNELQIVNHDGFYDIEFDAITEFFNYYQIPVPDYPLLDAELANPLFLKLACKALKSIDNKKKLSNINAIASGAKTLTKLYEDYVNVCAIPIGRKLSVQPRKCWEIIKGKKIPVNGEKKEVGIAPLMAIEGREYVYPDEFKKIIYDFTGFVGHKLDELYSEFINSGLLVLDIRWTKEKEKILRLPYQRISDSIIARALLRMFLATARSPLEVREQLKDNSLIGRVFSLRGYGWPRYEKPGLAEAIIMEFPEYTQRYIKDSEREIINFLPNHNSSIIAFSEPFLSGLIWRNNSNFNSCTSYLLSNMLGSDKSNIRENALRTLSNLSLRKDHIYNGKRFYSYMEKLSLIERDLFWTEYLRRSSNYTIKGRLLKWLSTHKIESINKDSACNFLYILSLFLCSTDNNLRDITTKEIFKIGMLYPDILFDHTINSLDFNDPYMFERMLAASYGVAMHCYAEKHNLNLIIDFAQRIYEAIFKANAKNSTTHFIIRDYASALLELVLFCKKDAFTEKQIERIYPPFKGMGIKRWGRAPSQEGYMPLDYDFRKNNIRPLANNYHDITSSNQVKIEQKILWRINKLGYTLNNFNLIDDEILRAQAYRTQNVSTYGMKYAYIAFNELLGWKCDRSLISIKNLSDNIYRPDVNIDPSFPFYTPHPNFVNTTLLKSSKQSLGNWVKNGSLPSIEKYLIAKNLDGINGNSILLNGDIFQKNKKSNRRLLMRIKGFLIRTANKTECLEKLHKTSINYNDIPEPLKTNFVYAGEIPWNKRFKDNFSSNRTVTKFKCNESFDDRTSPITQFLGIPVILPICTYSWRKELSIANQVKSVSLLAKFLIQDLNLHFKPYGMNFYNNNGDKVSSIIKNQEGEIFTNDYEFFYISEDIFKRYLLEENLTLVWIIWGERGLTYESLNAIQNNTINPKWKEFKRIRVYNPSS